ncbi:MAG: cadherin domain-containing protein, partial [Planctomycetaceae bacterium]|nr:cadherin domain-containing protein [Planctomycetaceae bacterium]
IQGNYIGTNASSAAGLGNGTGILISDSSNNTIGGTTGGARNIISANAGAGVIIAGEAADGNALYGNYIGTNVAGTAPLENGWNGVNVEQGADNTLIGGSTAAHRNIISGNLQLGIWVTDAATTGTIIRGNYVGLNASGTAAVSNGAFGIAVDFAATGTIIGGTGAGDRNVISGNTGSGGSSARGGIYVYGTNTTIQGNYIGIGADGTTVIANGQSAVGLSAGIYVSAGSGTLIGGTATGAGNIVAGNFGDGILSDLNAASSFTALRNSIYANTESGIDLGNDNGVTYNDLEDGDSGPNNLLNFPVITNVIQNGPNLDISFSLDVPVGWYRVEFYENASGADATGFGEGRSFLGAATVQVTTNPAGHSNFTRTLTGVTPATLLGISATITQDTSGGAGMTFGGTSEFGPSYLGAGVLVVDTATDVADAAGFGTSTFTIASLLGNRGADGKISLREAIDAANRTANLGGVPDEIRFSIPGVGVHTISVGTALPTISQAVIIDGTSQTGYAATPLIRVDGNSATGTVNGLTLAGSSGGTQISGLMVTRFTGRGIDISSDGNTIEASYIGTDGTNALGNGQAGIYFNSTASNNTVGGTTAGTHNIIAFSGWDGIRHNGTGTGNAFLGNSIYGNAEQAIDIGSQNLTLNDPGDGDSGNNNLMNFPVIYSAVLSGGNVTITGEAGAGALVEIFESPDLEGDYGEALTFIGRGTVIGSTPGTVDPGAVQFSFTFWAGSLSLGDRVTATATDSGNSTSEFSQNISVNVPPADIVFDSESTTEQQVNTYATSDQTDAAIAALPDGGYVVVWTSNGQDGSSFGIYAQRYNAAGVKVGGEILVTGEQTDSETGPSVSTFSDGGFVVAWQDQTSGVYAWTEARVFNADGTAATSEFKVSPGTDGNGEGYQPAVQTLDDNRFVVVWSNEVGGATYEIAGRIYDRTGALQGAHFTIGSLLGPSALFGAQAEVDLLQNGGFAVIWRTYDGVNFGTRMALRNADGSANPSGQITLDGAHRGDVAVLENGHIVFTYTDGANIQAVIYDDAGSVVVSEFNVSTTALAIPGEPTITRSDDGFVVAWESDTGDGNGTAILARRFAANGTPLSSEILVNQTSTGDQRLPELAVTASGQVRIVWQSQNLDGDGYAIASRVIATGTASVAENAATGTYAADVIGVFDLDAGDTHTFAFAPGGDAGGRFAINATTGVITVANGILLDYETATSHDITVRVTDSVGATYDEVLTISLINVDDNPPTLSVSGSATVSAGGTYTLNLAATDPDGVAITSWTINWGDGSIQTVAGNPSSVTHTYVLALAGHTFNITVSATDPSGAYFQSRLYVPSWAGTDLVHIYEGQSGTFVGTMAPFAEGLDDHIEVIQGPDGSLYVSSENGAHLAKYSPAGVRDPAFTFGGGHAVAGLAFGPDGNLYVANYSGNDIRRYDAATGAFIDIFVAAGTGGL